MQISFFKGFYIHPMKNLRALFFFGGGGFFFFENWRLLYGTKHHAARGKPTRLLESSEAYGYGSILTQIFSKILLSGHAPQKFYYILHFVIFFCVSYHKTETTYLTSYVVHYLFVSSTHCYMIIAEMNH